MNRWVQWSAFSKASRLGEFAGIMTQAAQAGLGSPVHAPSASRCSEVPCRPGMLQNQLNFRLCSALPKSRQQEEALQTRN